jgi:hypothetical protein
VLLIGGGVAVKLYMDSKKKTDGDGCKKAVGNDGNLSLSRPAGNTGIVSSTLPPGALSAITKGVNEPNAVFPYRVVASENSTVTPTVKNGALVFQNAGYAQFSAQTLDLKKGITFFAKVQLDKQASFQRIFEFGNPPPNHSNNIIFCVNDLNRMRWSVYETQTFEAICDMDATATKYGVPQIFVGRLVYNASTGVRLELESRSVSNPMTVESSKITNRDSTSLIYYANTRLLNNNFLGKGTWPGDPLANMTLSNFYFYNATLTSLQENAVLSYMNKA